MLEINGSMGMLRERLGIYRVKTDEGEVRRYRGSFSKVFIHKISPRTKGKAMFEANGLSNKTTEFRHRLKICTQYVNEARDCETSL